MTIDIFAAQMTRTKSKKQKLPLKNPAALPDRVSCQVLSWLLEAEDHLLSLHSLGQKQLETVSFGKDPIILMRLMMLLIKVRQRFYNHEDFMLELQSHQGAVRKVKTKIPTSFNLQF